MFSPTVRHIVWNTSVLPVKWIPARSLWWSTTSEVVARLDGWNVIALGRIHAASNIFIKAYPATTAVEAGFQITVLPISAGAVVRLPPIDVKLNGETA